MPLTLGTRLGPHEITAALDAGGMGEVYKTAIQINVVLNWSEELNHLLPAN